MPFVEFSEEDFKRGTLLDPGMYNVTVVFFKDDVDSKGAPLYKYRYKVFGHENPDFNDVLLFDQFSSKAMGFFMPFWEAVTGVKPVKGEQYDLEYPLNRNLRVNVKRDVYQGNPQNKVDGYAPYSE